MQGKITWQSQAWMKGSHYEMKNTDRAQHFWLWRFVFFSDKVSSYLNNSLPCSAQHTSALIMIEFILRLLTSPLSLSHTSQKTQSASDFMFRSSTFRSILALTSQIKMLSHILCWDSQICLRTYAVPYRKHTLLKILCLGNQPFLRK